MFRIETNRLILLALDIESLMLLKKDRILLEKHLNLEFSGHQISGETLEEVNDAMKFWIEGVEQNPDNYEWYTAWEIILKEKNQSIGGIGFTGLPDENGSTIVGYHVDERFRNEGFASEALQAMVNWAFKNEKLKQLIADTQKDNIASQQVLLKNGFEKESDNNELISWVLPRHRVTDKTGILENK